MSTPDDYPISPGDVLLGKYRVESVLGRGGMGIVVAARHLTLDERVAIKLLLPKCAADPQIVQRFLREARAAVRIRSQHIARVTDVGTLDSGAPYMVMDYLEGKDLSAVLDDGGSLSIPVAIDYVLQACEALAEAHSLGIVHRDIKPSNLFLARHADGSPCVKVLDFGISKMTHADDHAVTYAGGMLGSPLYMSPEQLRSSRDVDARADVYSMGVLLFELLTQERPFIAEELAQLIYKVMHDEPLRPRAVRPDLPPQLEQVILTAIAREREHRFPTVAHLASALAPFTPPHAFASIERIRGVLRVSTVDPYEARPQSASPSSPARPSVATVTLPLAADGNLSITPFGRTNRPPESRSRWTTPLMIMSAAALFLGVTLVGGGALLLRSRAKASAASESKQPDVRIEPVDSVHSESARSASADIPAPSAPAVASAPASSVLITQPSTTAKGPKPPSTVFGKPTTPKTTPKNPDPFQRNVF